MLIVAISTSWADDVTMDLALAKGSTPEPSIGTALLNGGAFDGNGYKMGSDGNYVGWNISAANKTFSAVSFNGYINTDNTSKNWGIQFSTDGGTTWGTELTQANDGTKSYHDIDVSVTIPEGANAVRIYRRAGTSTFVSSITLTLVDDDPRDALTLNFATTTGATYMTTDDTSLATSLSWDEDTSGEAAKYTISYTSSKTDVATVDANGVITKVGAGTTKITAKVTAANDATYKTTSASIDFSVINAANYYSYTGTEPVSISLEKTEISGYDGGAGTAKAYLTVTADKWSSETTADGITGNFFNMSSTDRSLELKVLGVSAFIVRDNNGTANRTYGISVNGTEKTVVTHGGTGVEASPIIATGTTGPVTIKLSGKGTGSTYPIRIILLNNEDYEAISFPSGYACKTYVTTNDVDFSDADVNAYIATSVGESSIATKKISKVPAGTPILVKMQDTDVKGAFRLLPFATSTEDVADNILESSDGTVTGGTGIYAYTYDSTDNKYGFYPVSSTVTIPSGKAYLNTGGAAPASFDVIFEDEVTAVDAIAETKVDTTAPVKVIKGGKLFIGNYNVAGQLVK